MLQVMRSNNWFPSLFDEFYNTAFGTSNRVATPAVNVIEDAKAYTMEFAVPGVTKEFCRVSINADGNLEVAIESKLEHKGEDKHEHYLRREFSYTNFQQTYTVPDDVIKENISAAVNDGVLAITLPKMAKEHVEKIQRHIEIK